MGIVGRSLAPTNMSRMFLFCLYAITGGRLTIWPPPYMPAEDFFLVLCFSKLLYLQGLSKDGTGSDVLHQLLHSYFAIFVVVESV